MSAGIDRSLPAVSTIVTNYNHGRFLRRRMESVLGQTLSPFEVIYLDDCSIDDSKDIIAPFLPDARLRCIENDHNSGSPFIQINRGVRLAQAELIWVAEADDYADSRFLENLVPIFAQSPSVGVAYCQSMQIDKDDADLSIVDYSAFPGAERWDRNFIANGVEECREYLLFRNTIPNFSAVVFRRKIFEEKAYPSGSGAVHIL